VEIAAFFSLDTVYFLTGLLLVLFATRTWTDQSNSVRMGSGLFWGLLGGVFLFGSYLPPWVTGLMVLAMVALDGLGLVAPSQIPEASEAERAERYVSLGPKLFLPVLTIPLLTGIGAFASARLGFDVNQGSLVGLGFGGVVAMGVALKLTGGTVRELVGEGWRLNEAMGTVNILPPRRPAEYARCLQRD
jgi:uncharacterized membrane protein